MSVQSTPVISGNARFTVYSPGCIRIEYANGAKFSPYPSVLVGKKAARGVRADVVRRGKSLRIKTDNFELQYRAYFFQLEKLSMLWALPSS